MKKNNFKGFYEDEESIKMMEIINKEADKEKERRIEFAKKEKKSDRWFKIGLFLTLAFIVGCFAHLSNELYKTNYEYCVANGHSATECETHLSR
jgi:hypothetical protein